MALHVASKCSWRTFLLLLPGSGDIQLLRRSRNMKSDPVEPGSLPIVAISREKGARTSPYNLAMQLEW
jgi:hypothetical protein